MIPQHIIQETKTDAVFHLAISGGVDSMALLHAMNNAVEDKKIVVHYVNHNVSKKSGAWGDFVGNEVKCLNDSSNNEIVFIHHNVFFEDYRNFESQAREKRYSSIYSKMADGEKLFLAHHSDDQVENVILNLFKGRGLNGLTSLREKNIVTRNIELIRPFLNVSKKDLVEYLSDIGKTHIEDDSNTSSDYDRNFIRNKLIKLALDRFKNLKPSILSTYNTLLSSRNALDELIEMKLEELKIESNSLTSINLHKFNKLSFSVKQEILVTIFRNNNFYTYSGKMIKEIIKQAENVEKSGRLTANIDLKNKDSIFRVGFDKKDKTKLLTFNYH